MLKFMESQRFSYWTTRTGCALVQRGPRHIAGAPENILEFLVLGTRGDGQPRTLSRNRELGSYSMNISCPCRGIILNEENSLAQVRVPFPNRPTCNDWLVLKPTRNISVELSAGLAETSAGAASWLSVSLCLILLFIFPLNRCYSQQFPLRRHLACFSPSQSLFHKETLCWISFGFTGSLSAVKSNTCSDQPSIITDTSELRGQDWCRKIDFASKPLFLSSSFQEALWKSGQARCCQRLGFLGAASRMQMCDFEKIRRFVISCSVPWMSKENDCEGKVCPLHVEPWRVPSSMGGPLAKC